MDAGYGADTDLRATITTLGLSYVAGIMTADLGVGTPGNGAAGTEEVVRSGTTAEADPP